MFYKPIFKNKKATVRKPLLFELEINPANFFIYQITAIPKL